jgi:hypothetical protein
VKRLAAFPPHSKDENWHRVTLVEKIQKTGQSGASFQFFLELLFSKT